MDSASQDPPQGQQGPPVDIITRADGSKYQVPKFYWDIDKEQAAADLAEGVYNIKEIANRAGVGYATLVQWRKNPNFQARVEEHREEFRKLVMAYGITRRETRIAHLQDRHDRLCSTIEERGKVMAEKHPDVAGARHGYVFEHLTAQGTEFRIDTKTAALLADIERQAAIEVGEWNEGNAPSVAVQIVCPATQPPASLAPTVTIGRRQI